MNAELRASLLGELEETHAAFVSALDDVEPGLVTAPGLVEEWSARDLVAHVAFWSDHGADALALAASGRGSEFAYDSAQTDAMNAEVFAGSQHIAPDEARSREAAAYRRFHDALAALDPALLDLALGNGHVVAAVVRYDGPDHYAEHTEHLRAWFTADPDEADAEDGDGDTSDARHGAG